VPGDQWQGKRVTILADWRVGPPLELAALQGSITAEVRCDGDARMAPHLVVPYSLSTNDSKYGRGTFATGDDFFTYCRDAFDFLYREGVTQPRMLSIGLHMRVIGHPARASGLERLLDHVRSVSGVWITRRLDIARHWIATHSPE